MKHLFRSKSLTWEIAPTIKWNIFSGGERLNATREARAALDQSIISFNSTLLTAVQEVESAMSQYKSSVEQIVSLREAVNQNEETLTLSLELYKQGLTEYQNVLDAQRTLLTYQGYLVQAQGGSLIYLVQLYEALGGGW
jgi:outer membrane protein TolC